MSVIMEKLRERLAKAKEAKANATTVTALENANKRIKEIEKEMEQAQKLLSNGKKKKR